jgi:hypothetical protein
MENIHMPLIMNKITQGGPMNWMIFGTPKQNKFQISGKFLIFGKYLLYNMRALTFKHSKNCFPMG